jgi:hypothetical protein
MTLKLIGFSFIICIVLTLIFSNIFRPHSSVFLPSFVLQLFSYGIMVLCILILNKTHFNKTPFIYILSFILSYITLLFVLWRINGGEFILEITKIHKGKDFMSMLFPYITSNILIVLYILLYKK